MHGGDRFASPRGKALCLRGGGSNKAYTNEPLLQLGLDCSGAAKLVHQLHTHAVQYASNIVQTPRGLSLLPLLAALKTHIDFYFFFYLGLVAALSCGQSPLPRSVIPPPRTERSSFFYALLPARERCGCVCV